MGAFRSPAEVTKVDIQEIKGTGFVSANDALVALRAVLDAIKGKTDKLKDSWNDPSAAAVADSVWDEGYAAHQTADTFGKLLATAQADEVGAMMPARGCWVWMAICSASPAATARKPL